MTFFEGFMEEELIVTRRDNNRQAKQTSKLKRNLLVLSVLFVQKVLSYILSISSLSEESIPHGEA